MDIFRRHLPRGRWTQEMLDGMPWRERSEIARYSYRTASSRRGSKKLAQRRIHKIERQRGKKFDD